MPTYKVVRPCYVPIGEGARYKTLGQVITISEEEAKNLEGDIVPLSAPVSVRNPDTGIAVRKPDTGLTVRNPDTPAQSPLRGATGATMGTEVDSDVSDP